MAQAPPTVDEWQAELYRARRVALGLPQDVRGPMWAALEYALEGFAIFPCRPRGKEPLTAHGWKDASKDDRAIRRWFERWPTANIGIACGKVSGLVVLDFDVKGGQPGLLTLRRMAATYGAATTTAAVTTASGGIHLWYRYPEGGCPSRKSGKLGLEIKSDGTYVIAPPSVIDYDLSDPKNAGCPATGAYCTNGPLTRARLMEVPF